MPSIKDLKKRVKSVKSTQQITRTMQMVAAARLKKTESRVQEAREYGNKIAEMTRRMSGSAEGVAHPLFEKREVKNILLAIVTSDRGLCGSYNSNVIAKAEEFLNSHKDGPAKVTLVTIGKKGDDYFKKRGYEIVESYLDLRGEVNVQAISEITECLTGFFLDGKVDEVYLLFTVYQSAMRYYPKVEKYLNIGQLPDDAAAEKQEEIEYIYEPEMEGILDKLLSQYIKNRMLLSISESFIAENNARMISMKNATDNADEMIGSLSLQANRVRQTAITTEILEIIAGTEAMKRQLRIKANLNY